MEHLFYFELTTLFYFPLQQMVSGSTFVFAGYPFQQKQKGYFKHIVLLETVLKKLGGKLVNRAVKLNDWEFISNQ